MTDENDQTPTSDSGAGTSSDSGPRNDSRPATGGGGGTHHLKKLRKINPKSDWALRVTDWEDYSLDKSIE